MRTERIRQVLWLASALLALAVVYCGAALLAGRGQLAVPLSTPRLQDLAAGQRSEGSSAEKVESYSVIWEKGLGRAAEPPTPLAPPAVPAAAESFPFELLGTFVEGSGAGWALLSEKGADKHHLASPGEQVGNFKIARVGAGFVVFEAGGRLVTLETRSPSQELAAHVREVVPGVGTGPGASSAAPERAPGQAAGAGAPAGGGTGPAEVVVASFSDGDWERFLSQARLVPVLSTADGAVTGIRLTNVGGLVAGLLREGDIVTRVGDERAVDPGPLFRLGDHRDARGVVRLTVERDGRPLEIHCARAGGG